MGKRSLSCKTRVFKNAYKNFFSKGLSFADQSWKGSDCAINSSALSAHSFLFWKDDKGKLMRRRSTSVRREKISSWATNDKLKLFHNTGGKTFSNRWLNKTQRTWRPSLQPNWSSCCSKFTGFDRHNVEIFDYANIFIPIWQKSLRYHSIRDTFLRLLVKIPWHYPFSKKINFINIHDVPTAQFFIFRPSEEKCKSWRNEKIGKVTFSEQILMSWFPSVCPVELWLESY